MKKFEIFGLLLCGSLSLQLAACSTPTPPTSVSGQVQKDVIDPVDQGRAQTPKTVSFKGRLVLFGPELDAWLGLRDDQGQVIRLVFDNQTDFETYRAQQNQNVQIRGILLSNFLGLKQLRVSHNRP